jgi:hypothetical protein
MTYIVHCDGLDHYTYVLGGTLQKWDGISITGSAVSFGNVSEISSVYGRPSLSDTNTGGMYVAPGTYFGNACSVQYLKNFNAQLATIYAGFAIKTVTGGAGAATADCIIWAVQDGTTTQVDLRLTAAGQLYFTRNGTTIGSTSLSALSQGVWYYLEVKVVIHPSAGIAELRINGSGTGWITLSGQNTRSTANTYGTRYWLGGFNLGGTGPCLAMQYDDHVVNTNGFLGDVRVNGQFAAALGSVNQWTRNIAAWPSATAVVKGTQILDSNGKVQRVTSISGSGTTGGSAPTWNTTTGLTTTDNAGANQVIWTNMGPPTNMLAISELPNPDANFSYMGDGTVGHAERYTFPAIAGSQVFAIVGWPNACKDDAGSRAIRVVVRSAGSDGDNGVDLAMGASFGYQAGIIENDPATGLPFSVAALNAAEIGFKVTV